MRLIKPDVSEKEINEVLDIACLTKFISSLSNGINTEIGEAGKLMSGGERQRLSIAMGLLRQNKFLLLDEVTANLDVDTTIKLERNLRKLLTKGYTIVSISHDKNFLDVSDLIYEVKEKTSIRLK